MPVKLSVIICSYNRADYIIGAIDSLYHQTASKDLYEVIIVDNNSRDNTKDICLTYISTHRDCSIYYLEEKEQGASFARNTGSAMAKGELLTFMDDDAIAQNDFIEKIIRFFESHSGIAGLGGRIIAKYIPEVPKWMSHYVSSLVGNFNYAEKTTAFKNGKFPLESNTTVYKKDFDRVGGFTTALPGVKGTLRIGGEGKELLMKITSTGGLIYYDPSIIVHHIVEVKKLTREYLYRIASGIGRGERARTKAISRFSYFKKIAEYIYKLIGSVVLGIVYILQGNPSKAAPVINFRIDALKGLFNK